MYMIIKEVYKKIDLRENASFILLLLIAKCQNVGTLLTKSEFYLSNEWIAEILPGGGYQPRPTEMGSIPFRQLTPD